MSLQEQLAKKQQKEAMAYIQDNFVSINDAIKDIDELTTMAEALVELKYLPLVKESVVGLFGRIETVLKESVDSKSIQEEFAELLSIGAFVKESLTSKAVPTSEVGLSVLKETQFASKRLPKSVNREELWKQVRSLTKEQKQQVSETVKDFGYPVFLTEVNWLGNAVNKVKGFFDNDENHDNLKNFNKEIDKVRAFASKTGMQNTLQAITKAESAFEEEFASATEHQVGSDSYSLGNITKGIGGKTGGQLNLVDDAKDFVVAISKMFKVFSSLAGLGSLKSQLSDPDSKNKTIEELLSASDDGGARFQQTVVGLFNKLLNGVNTFDLTAEGFTEDVVSLSVPSFLSIMKHGPGLNVGGFNRSTKSVADTEAKKLQTAVSLFQKFYGTKPEDLKKEDTELIMALLPYMKEGIELEQDILNEGWMDWFGGKGGKIMDFISNDEKSIKSFSDSIKQIQSFVANVDMPKLKGIVNTLSGKFENTVHSPGSKEAGKSKSAVVSQIIEFSSTISKLFTSLAVFSKLPSFQKVLSNQKLNNQKLSSVVNMLPPPEGPELKDQVTNLTNKIYQKYSKILGAADGLAYTEEDFSGDIFNLTLGGLNTVIQAGPKLNIDAYLKQAASEVQGKVKQGSTATTAPTLDPKSVTTVTDLLRNRGITYNPTSPTPEQIKLINVLIKAGYLKAAAPTT